MSIIINHPIVALHGFMGSPSDFKVLDLSLRAPYIFFTQLSSLEDWAKRFNRTLSKKTVALGYSMGGRLLLHCILENPTLYHAAIIIVAHPGIHDEHLRYERLENDRIWSKKFKTLPWQSLMFEWENTQALRGSVVIQRRESDYDRISLATAMRTFSLGSQSYLIPHINDINIPILWLTRGQELANSEGLSLKHPLSECHVIKGSHRFIFEEPSLITNLIKKFLSKIS